MFRAKGARRGAGGSGTHTSGRFAPVLPGAGEQLKSSALATRVAPPAPFPGWPVDWSTTSGKGHPTWSAVTLTTRRGGAVPEGRAQPEPLGSYGGKGEPGRG